MATHQRLGDLAEALEAEGADELRVHVVRRAREFKRSWVNMAEALVEVRNRESYLDWGYEDFYSYCSLELQLKQATADKLTGSYVALTPARGPRGERWLLAGDSIELALEKYPAPWLLEIRGESSSVTQIEVISEVEEPLLYGSKLEDIRTIHEKLNG